MMKYKVGDRVRIKTWDQMKSEFGVQDGYIDCKLRFTPEMEENVKRECPNRIFVIKFADDNDHADYRMETSGRNWSWSEEMIECLEEDYKVTTLIPVSRFELMDFS